MTNTATLNTSNKIHLNTLEKKRLKNKTNFCLKHHTERERERERERDRDRDRERQRQRQRQTFRQRQRDIIFKT